MMHHLLLIGADGRGVAAKLAVEFGGDAEAVDFLKLSLRGSAVAGNVCDDIIDLF
jgi:hypothetical protein